MHNFPLGHWTHLCSIYRDHIECVTVYRENFQFIAFTCTMNHYNDTNIS